MPKLTSSVEQVLILKWTDLPKDMQDIIKGHHAFGNDRMLKYGSEMSPSDNDKTWADSLSMNNIKLWFQLQIDDNDYTGDLASFIKDEGLEFDVWLLNSGFDLNVSRILIDVCW